MVRRIALPGGLLAIGLLVVVGYVTSSTSASGQQLLGDVDCNQQVNSIDAALILQVDAGLFASLHCEDAADVSQDGATNAVDAALILQFNAGLLGGFGKVPSVPTLASTATPPPGTTPHNTATPPLTATRENTATPPPVTMLPESTATPPTTPTNATPPPTPDYECSPWPDEILELMERLPVPEGLCLVIFSEAPLEFSCPRGCYYPSRLLVGCVVDCFDSFNGTILYHEVCHAHQHRVITDSGLSFTTDNPWETGGWGWAYVDETSEGKAFIDATEWSYENNTWVEQGEPGWSGYPDPLEDSANVCAFWYGNREELKNGAPIRYEWAQTWLPE